MMTHQQGCAFVVALFLLLLITSPGVWAQTNAGDQHARVQVPLPRGELMEKFGPASPGLAETNASVIEHQPIPPQQSNPAQQTDIPESKQTLKRALAPPSAATWSQNQRCVDRSREGFAEGSFWNALPLLAVLALIGAIALVVKRFMPTRRFLTGAGVLEIVARMPLSGKQSLVLVKMGRRLVLLGVSSDRVNSLDVVDDPDQVSVLIGEAARHKPDAVSSEFASAFTKEVHAYAEEPIGHEVTSSARGHVQGLLKKVRQLTQGGGVM